MKKIDKEMVVCDKLSHMAFKRRNYVIFDGYIRSSCVKCQISHDLETECSIL